MSVMTKQHQWVKHTVTYVSVLPDEDGSPVVFVDPEEQTLAEEEAAYGCSICGKVLVGNMDTECDPDNEDLTL